MMKEEAISDWLVISTITIAMRLFLFRQSKYGKNFLFQILSQSSPN